MPLLKVISTNVITGFLGAGKSTAILHLLKHKPADERWAVLVNEFGEVGIDGSALAGLETENGGVYIREVAGGCMCCTAGMPMQIALNMLLSRARPHRLLIEPTGLGHPREVLGVLASDHYREVLDLRATVALVDARHVRNSRYTEHPTFNQQLEIADVIVANKADLYQTGNFPDLLSFLETTGKLDNKSVYQVSQGAIRLNWLLAPAGNTNVPAHLGNDQGMSVTQPQSHEIPEKGYLSIDNEGDGFRSRGWIFSPQWIFDAQGLYSLLSGVTAERVKGVFITNRGIIYFNKAGNVLTEADLDDSQDSRIECITTDKRLLETLETALLGCVID